MTSASKVLLALALATGTAAAQQPKPDPAADSALAEGRRLYDLQEWDKAIAKFKEAYSLRDSAAALFNIAQTYRMKNDCANAAHFYRTFKKKFPTEKNIDKVEKFIAEMEACAKTQPATVTTTPIPEPTGTTTEPKPEPPKEDPMAHVSTTAITSPATTRSGGTMRLTGMIVAGVGAVALGGGVFFGLRARSASSEAEDLGAGDMWMPGIEERGESAETKAKILLIGGGAAVAAGTILFTLGAKATTERTSVGVVPSGGGATFVWSGGF